MSNQPPSPDSKAANLFYIGDLVALARGTSPFYFLKSDFISGPLPAGFHASNDLFDRRNTLSKVFLLGDLLTEYDSSIVAESLIEQFPWLGNLIAPEEIATAWENYSKYSDSYEAIGTEELFPLNSQDPYPSDSEGQKLFLEATKLTQVWYQELGAEHGHFLPVQSVSDFRKSKRKSEQKTTMESNFYDIKNTESVKKYFTTVFEVAELICGVLIKNGIKFENLLKTDCLNDSFDHIPFNGGIGLRYYSDLPAQILTPLGRLEFMSSLSFKRDSRQQVFLELSKTLGLIEVIQGDESQGARLGPIYSIQRDGKGNNLPEADLTRLHVFGTRLETPDYQTFRNMWAQIKPSVIEPEPDHSSFYRFANQPT